MRQDESNPYDDAPIGVFESTREGRLLYANAALARMLGYESPQAALEGVADIGAQVYAEPTRRAQILTDALDNGQAVVPDLRMRRRDGSDWVGHVVTRAVADAEGGRQRFQGFISDVTERTRAESRLRESEQLYRTVLDQAADVIHLHDMEGNFVDVNRAACESLGYTREELLKMSVWDIDPEAVTRGDAEHHWAVMPATLQSHHRRKDGTLFPVEIRTGAVSVDGRRLVLALVRDVTERREAEDQERQHYRDLETLNAAVAGLVSATEEEAVFRTVAEAMERLVPSARVLVARLSPDEQSLRIAALGGMRTDLGAVSRIAGGDVWTRDYPLSTATPALMAAYRDARLVRLEGGLYEAALCAIPHTACRAVEKLFRVDAIYCAGIAWGDKAYGGVVLALPAGCSIESRAGAIEAIVRQAASADQRLRAQRALRLAEERFRLLVNNSADANFIVDEAGVLQYASSSVERIMGAAPEQLVGTQIFDAMYPEDRERSAAAFAACLKEPRATATFEYRVTAQDGLRVMEAIAQNLIDVPAVGGVVINVRNITARKRAEEEVQAGVDRLRVVLEATIMAMGAMVASRDRYTAGHERRVAELAEVIARKLGLSDWQTDAVRMAGLVHDVGKIAVPAEILTRPGRLTDLEFAMVKEHAQAGFEMLRSIEFEWPLAEIVHSHHERLDGSGYPRGLTGEAFGIEARILGVADVVEAMASHRPYRPALGMTVALAEVEQNRGRLYDAVVVDACLSVIRDDGFEFSD